MHGMHPAPRLLLLVLPLLACSTAPVEPDALVVVPMTLAHGLAFTEVDLPGHGPVLALVDTGANASAVDSRLAADLPRLETAQVIGTTGAFEVDLVRLEGLRVGELRLPPLRATRRELGGLLAPEGRTVGMILGSDALAGRAVTLDFVESRIEIGGATPHDPAGVAMLLDEGIPAISATLGGVDLWLRIDTGASLFDTEDVYVNLPAHAWERVSEHAPKRAPSTTLLGTGADGREVPLPVFSIEGVRIGPLELERAHVIVQPQAGYFADPEA
jgi:hypothetical protein